MSKILISNFSSNDKRFRHCQQIRNQVFVSEQGVDPNLEMDIHDKQANHYLLSLNNSPVGTARWRYAKEGIKLERFAILKEHRNLGYGSKIVLAVLKDIRPFNKCIYLNSQLNAIRFYQNLGFEVKGSCFEEAGIKHYKMVFKD